MTLGISELSRNLKLSGVVDKLEASGGKDLEQVLTRGEQALLRSWMAKLEAQAERAEDLSAGYEAGSVGADVLEAALETALTAGIGKAATAPARAALKRWVAKRLPVSGTLGRGLAGGAVWAGENALKGSVVTALRPATYVNISRRLADFKRDEQGQLLLDERGLPRPKPLADAVAEGAVESFIDNFTDGTGKLAAGAFRTGRDLADRQLSQQMLRELKELGGRVASGDLGGMYKRLAAAPAYRFLTENVAPKLAGKWSDAVFGDLLKAVTSGDRTLGDVLSLEEQLKTVASLLPALFVEGIVDKAGVLRAKARYRQELDGLRKELGSVRSPQAKALAERLETDSVDELSKQLASLIGEQAGKDAEAAPPLPEGSALSGDRSGNLPRRRFRGWAINPGGPPRRWVAGRSRREDSFRRFARSRPDACPDGGNGFARTVRSNKCE